MRRSKYYTELLPLPVEWLETDGKASDIPVIFEDRYYHIELEPEGGSRNSSHPPPVAVSRDPILRDEEKFLKDLHASDVATINGIVADYEDCANTAKLKSVKKIEEAPESDKRNHLLIFFVKTYLERALPMQILDFLMSRSVSGGATYRNIEHLTEVFECEFLDYLTALEKLPEKISLMGHSLGALLLRSAITHPAMEPYLDCLHTFLSFCGHGVLYNRQQNRISGAVADCKLNMKGFRSQLTKLMQRDMKKKQPS